MTVLRAMQVRKMLRLVEAIPALNFFIGILVRAMEGA